MAKLTISSVPTTSTMVKVDWLVDKVANPLFSVVAVIVAASVSDPTFLTKPTAFPQPAVPLESTLSTLPVSDAVEAGTSLTGFHP